MSILIYDIETSSLALDSEIYMIGIKNTQEQEVEAYTKHYLYSSSGNIQSAIERLTEADILVGFNSIAFDKAVIEYQYNIKLPKQIDLLLVLKLMYTKEELLSIDMGIPNFPPSLKGSYSLAAFGIRFGNYKLDYSDFSKLTQEMVTYCKQDCSLTEAIYLWCRSQDNYPSDRVLDLESSVREILSEQERNGFYFDIDAARTLNTKMLFEKLTIEQQLHAVFKPKFIPDSQVKECIKPFSRSEWVENLDFKGWFV